MGLVALTGGGFSTPNGQPLSNGYLLLTLSHDEQSDGTKQLLAGHTIKIPLDNVGKAAAGSQAYATDQMLPSGAYYNVTVYDNTGQLVSTGTQTLTLTSSPNPYNLGSWVPS